MMRRCAVLPVVTALVLWGLGAGLWAGDAEPLKIGVVNVSKVFDDYRKKKDREVILEKERSELQAELDKMEKVLKKLEQEMEFLKGEEQVKKKREFDDKREEYKAFYKVNNKDLQRDQCRFWSEIHNEIVEEVGKFGEKQDFDLIFKTDNGPIRGGSLEEIQLRVDLRKVLFHSPKTDITEEIIKSLNDRYRSIRESKEKGT